MGKVLPFQPKAADLKSAERLVELSIEVDDAMIRAIQEGIDPMEIVGVVAHRLGVMMSHIHQKNELWPFCEKVLKQQAKID